MRRRAETYNAAREKLFQLEREGRALVFAPHSTRGFSRTERDVEKIRALWQDGCDQGRERLAEVRAFWGQGLTERRRAREESRALWFGSTAGNPRLSRG